MSNINTNFHLLVQREPEKKDAVYTEYRNEWDRRPIEFDSGKFPLFLDIEATNMCNLKCPHCYQTRSNWDPGFIDFQLFEKIIMEGVQHSLYGCKFHTIGRGEPLMHPALPNMIAFAKKWGLIDVWVNTNGILLTERLAYKLFEGGLDKLVISIDAYNAKDYERRRVGAVFNGLLQNIQRLYTLRERGGYNTLIRIQSINFPNIDFDTYCSFWSPWADEISMIDYKNMMSRTYGLESNWICPQPWQRMSILYDGTVLPCNHDDRLLAKLGNVQTDSIMKLWHSSGMKLIRMNHQEGTSHFIDACDGCYLRTSEIMKREIE